MCFLFHGLAGGALRGAGEGVFAVGFSGGRGFEVAGLSIDQGGEGEGWEEVVTGWRGKDEEEEGEEEGGEEEVEKPGEEVDLAGMG